jgi:hypothetical protein
LAPHPRSSARHFHSEPANAAHFAENTALYPNKYPIACLSKTRIKRALLHFPAQSLNFCFKPNCKPSPYTIVKHANFLFLGEQLRLLGHRPSD